MNLSGYRFAHALVAILLVTVAFAPSPARADRCDELAAQLKSQIDGLSVGKTAANVIYLEHPSASQIRLGCANRNVTNELFAEAPSRKPSAEFMNVVASAAAIVFTIPRTDTARGAARCMRRLGIFRGDNVPSRFRRLDMVCTRSKTNSTIAISREKDT